MSIEKVNLKGGKTRYRVRWREGREPHAVARSRVVDSMREARDLEAAIRTGNVPTRGAKATVADFMGQYIDRLWDETKPAANGHAALRPSSASALAYALKLFVSRLPTGLRIEDISKAHCKDALHALAMERPKASVQLSRSAATRMFNRAVDMGIIPHSPVPVGREFRYPGAEHESKRGLPAAPTPEQVVMMAKAALDPTDRALILFAASTGLRRSELLGLTWDDVNIDTDSPMVSVRRTLVQYDDKDGKRVHQLRDGAKNASSVRSFQLSPTESAVLRLHRVHQQEFALRTGDAWGTDCFIFPDTHQLRIHAKPDAVSHRLARLRNKCGIDANISPLHGFRHASAVELLGRLDITVLAKRLGHRTPNTTMEVYAKPAQRHMEEAATQADSAWAGAIGAVLAPRQVG